MPHMIPAIEHMTMLQVETNIGTEIVPAEICGLNATPESLADYLEGKPREDAEIETVTGWFARLSAPGYMDCTEWSGPFDTEAAARQYIVDTYDVDGETGEDLDA